MKGGDYHEPASNGNHATVGFHNARRGFVSSGRRATGGDTHCLRNHVATVPKRRSVARLNP